MKTHKVGPKETSHLGSEAQVKRSKLGRKGVAGVRHEKVKVPTPLGKKYGLPSLLLDFKKVPGGYEITTNTRIGRAGLMQWTHRCENVSAADWGRLARGLNKATPERQIVAGHCYFTCGVSSALEA